MKKFSPSEKYDIFPNGQKRKPQKRPGKLPPKAKKIAKKHNSTKQAMYKKREGSKKTKSIKFTLK